jgi:hypothetical protein
MLQYHIVNEILNKKFHTAAILVFMGQRMPHYKYDKYREGNEEDKRL